MKKAKLVLANFDARISNISIKPKNVATKVIYLLEGDYDYDENEPADLLNVMDLNGSFRKEIGSYSAYVQNVDAGVYIIVAKGVSYV